MIVRIARVKVGNRQAPFANQDPALKSGVLAFVRLQIFRANTEKMALSSHPLLSLPEPSHT